VEGGFHGDDCSTEKKVSQANGFISAGQAGSLSYVELFCVGSNLLRGETRQTIQPIAA
jgi:hypothetical protein